MHTRILHGHSDRLTALETRFFFFKNSMRTRCPFVTLFSRCAGGELKEIEVSTVFQETKATRPCFGGLNASTAALERTFLTNCQET